MAEDPKKLWRHVSSVLPLPPGLKKAMETFTSAFAFSPNLLFSRRQNKGKMYLCAVLVFGIQKWFFDTTQLVFGFMASLLTQTS